MEAFGINLQDENDCALFLKDRKEKLGVKCKSCGCEKHYWLKSKMQWQCQSCSFRTTLKSGTLFESSKLSLSIWFQALYIVSEVSAGISSRELQRRLGLRRNEPAWFMLHKIRRAMANVNDFKEQSGKVVFSEMFFGIFETSSRTRNGVIRDFRRNELKCRDRRVCILSDRFEEGKKASMVRLINVRPVAVHTIWSIENADDIGKSNYRYWKILSSFNGSMLSKVSSKISTELPWMTELVEDTREKIVRVYHQISDHLSQNYFEEYSFKNNLRKASCRLNAILTSAILFLW